MTAFSVAATSRLRARFLTTATTNTTSVIVTSAAAYQATLVRPAARDAGRSDKPRLNCDSFANLDRPQPLIVSEAGRSERAFGSPRGRTRAFLAKTAPFEKAGSSLKCWRRRARPTIRRTACASVRQRTRSHGSEPYPAVSGAILHTITGRRIAQRWVCPSFASWIYDTTGRLRLD